MEESLLIAMPGCEALPVAVDEGKISHTHACSRFNAVKTALKRRANAYLTHMCFQPGRTRRRNASRRAKNGPEPAFRAIRQKPNRTDHPSDRSGTAIRAVAQLSTAMNKRLLIQPARQR
jgi:hypothetical protein